MFAGLIRCVSTQIPNQFHNHSIFELINALQTIYLLRPYILEKTSSRYGRSYILNRYVAVFTIIFTDIFWKLPTTQNLSRTPFCKILHNVIKTWVQKFCTIIFCICNLLKLTF